MNIDTPRVEILTPQSSTIPPDKWYRSRRFKIFASAFLVFNLIGQVYVFQRPAIYQSKTTLLTTAPSLLDQPNAEANIQHVAVQGNILTGRELLEKTREKLVTFTAKEVPPVVNIHDMLLVRPVAETNLIELLAEGNDNQLLPLLLNSLTEQYETFRQQQIEINTDKTTGVLGAQLENLTLEVEEKRDELDRFRSTHSILSMARDENQVLARLKGLNESLNKASDSEVNSKARVDAIRKSIQQGRPVVPDSDKRELVNLQQRAQELRERLSELDRRFTRDYLALQPSLKVIPEQLEAVQRKIRGLKQEGQSIVLTEAEQTYQAAKQATAEITQQIKDYKSTATEFTRRFAEHEALVLELEDLEQNQREVQDRLIQIKVEQREKFPQMKVVEAAYATTSPIRPAYWRDSAIVLFLASIAGLLLIWLFEFLKKDEKPETSSIPGWIQITRNDNGHQPLGFDEKPAQLNPSETATLESHPHPGLTTNEINQLLISANDSGKLAISLLLSGLTPEEITADNLATYDAQNGHLEVNSTPARKIKTAPAVSQLLSDTENIPTDNADIEALVTCAAYDSTLKEPASINTSLLRKSYIIYLVRQGLKLSELEKIIGPTPTQELAGYATYLPEQAGKTIDEVDLFYPALKAS